MPRDTIHMWSCDAGEYFEDDDGLARRLASRIDDGEERVMFAREGCMFRLTYEDRPQTASTTPPADALWRSRTYSVTLLTNSPTCIGGNLFTATWPNGYEHPPVRMVAKDAPSDAPVIVGDSMNDLLRLLTGIGTVLWPERYDL
jgi:hypothetical protein